MLVTVPRRANTTPAFPSRHDASLTITEKKLIQGTVPRDGRPPPEPLRREALPRRQQVAFIVPGVGPGEGRRAGAGRGGSQEAPVCHRGWTHRLSHLVGTVSLPFTLLQYICPTQFLVFTRPASHQVPPVLQGDAAPRRRLHSIGSEGGEHGWLRRRVSAGG